MKEEEETNPRDYGIVAGEMGFAVLAAKYLVGVEVGVVDEAHPVNWPARAHVGGNLLLFCAITDISLQGLHPTSWYLFGRVCCSGGGGVVVCISLASLMTFCVDEA